MSDVQPKQPTRVCAVCLHDWCADDGTMLCRTCRAVDDLLANYAGSDHFLPHIDTVWLHEQPQNVMTCAMHRLQHPKDTGFYGVYTTMSLLLRRAGKSAIAERKAANSLTAVEELELLPQPSHADSLAAIATLTEAHFNCSEAWLSEHLSQARASCAELDAAMSDAAVSGTAVSGTPNSAEPRARVLSDFDRIRLVQVLR